MSADISSGEIRSENEIPDNRMEEFHLPSALDELSVSTQASKFTRRTPEPAIARIKTMVGVPLIFIFNDVRRRKGRSIISIDQIIGITRPRCGQTV